MSRAEVLDRFFGRDADGEVVEACRRLGACRVQAQRELWPAVGVAHRDSRQRALLDELDRCAVAEPGFIPCARPGEVANRQLNVVDAVQLWRVHEAPRV